MSFVGWQSVADHERVTLIFSSRDEERNNAVVVKQYLEMLGRMKGVFRLA